MIHLQILEVDFPPKRVLQSLRAELTRRQKSYPAKVERGEMTVSYAEEELAIIASLVRHYERLTEPTPNMFEQQDESA